MVDVILPSDLVGMKVEVVAASYDSIVLKLPNGAKVMITPSDDSDFLEFGVIEEGD